MKAIKSLLPEGISEQLRCVARRKSIQEPGIAYMFDLIVKSNHQGSRIVIRHQLLYYYSMI